MLLAAWMDVRRARKKVMGWKLESLWWCYRMTFRLLVSLYFYRGLSRQVAAPASRTTTPTMRATAGFIEMKSRIWKSITSRCFRIGFLVGLHQESASSSSKSGWSHHGRWSTMIMSLSMMTEWMWGVTIMGTKVRMMNTVKVHDDADILERIRRIRSRSRSSKKPRSDFIIDWYRINQTQSSIKRFMIQ